MLGYYRKWDLGYDLKHDVLCTVWSWGYKSSIETAFKCIDYSHLHATIFFLKSFNRYYGITGSSDMAFLKFFNAILELLRKYY